MESGRPESGMTANPPPVVRTRLRLALAACAALACGDVDEYRPDCSGLIGQHFIEVAPPPDVFNGHLLAVGDSLHLVPTLRRTTEVAPTFNPQAGWGCRTTASVPVPTIFAFSTPAPAILRVHPTGGVRALEVGVTHVRIDAAGGLATHEAWVTVVASLSATAVSPRGS